MLEMYEYQYIGKFINISSILKHSSNVRLHFTFFMAGIVIKSLFMSTHLLAWSHPKYFDISISSLYVLKSPARLIICSETIRSLVLSAEMLHIIVFQILPRGIL